MLLLVYVGIALEEAGLAGCVFPSVAAWYPAILLGKLSQGLSTKS